MRGILCFEVDKATPLLTESWLEEHSKPFEYIRLYRTFNPELELRIGKNAYYLSSREGLIVFEFQIEQRVGHCVVFGKIRLSKSFVYVTEYMIVFVNIYLILLSWGLEGFSVIIPIISVIFGFFLKGRIDYFYSKRFEKRIRDLFEPIMFKEEPNNRTEVIEIYHYYKK